MPIRTQRSFNGGAERYYYDLGPCSARNGFAQIDSRQDAPWYGTWCSPSERKVVSFVEGDVAETVCDTDEEFVQYLREMADWFNGSGNGPMKIDAGLTEAFADKFRALGVGDLLHGAPEAEAGPDGP